MVAWREAALGFEKDAQLLVLLALVFVFERTRMVFERTWMVVEGLEDSVVPGPGQRCDMARGAKKTHTFLFSGLLLDGGERGGSTS